MAVISFLNPLDQPLGNRRLLNELIECLQSEKLSAFKFAVGFAKLGPLLRLSPHIESWRSRGKTIEGIFGIDLLGTSQQALQFALKNFDHTYVTNQPASRQNTFHPKLYIFHGQGSATCFYGSHNLTVGGTETNFEGGVRFDFDLKASADEETFQSLLDSWTSLLPGNCLASKLLTDQLLHEYARENRLLDEDKPSSSIRTTPKGNALPRASIAPMLPVKPPSSIPRSVIAPSPRASKRKKVDVTAPKPTVVGESLVIQIIPRPNGEIFLSKGAVNQNPGFFGFPFTGRTIPKKPSNPSYPQREPDPVVNIVIWDRSGNNIEELSRSAFRLNMVYYKAKSEIRITVNPEIARSVPKYSILVMSRANDMVDLDYELEIYYPNSPKFNEYLAVCNQTLPSGGAQKQRKMGWL